MLSPIQFVLITAFVLLAFVCVRSSLFGRTVPLLVGIAGCFFVLVPQKASELAHLMGVGRGADLVMYLYVALTLFLFLRFQIRIKALEDRTTELIRHIALLNAKRLGEDPRNG